jgi:hypothetical protein
MNKREINNLSGWKPATNEAFETSTGDPRGIIVDNNTIEAWFAMKIRVAAQNVSCLCPVNL